MSHHDPAELLQDAYQRLRALNARWVVELWPRDGEGWLAGESLRAAESPAFQQLLRRIHTRMETADRKVVAAAFALRFGWSSAVAFGPHPERGVVPDLSLDNISLRFGESALFEIVLAALGRAHDALEEARLFFDAEGLAFAAKPSLYSVEHAGVSGVYQCRSSCCLYYKCPTGSYCASCPLISQQERVQRNKQWIERMVAAV